MRAYEPITAPLPMVMPPRSFKQSVLANDRALLDSQVVAEGQIHAMKDLDACANAGKEVPPSIARKRTPSQ